jgi:predicted nucleic acid-binding protein
MIKHQHQTCLRMPNTIKEDMTNICTKHKINESDFMRKAIVGFIEKVNTTPEEDSRYMFV